MTIDTNKLKTDLKQLIEKHEDNYSRLLRSKKYESKYNGYVEEIMHLTSKLDEVNATFATRIYWVLHDLTDFPRCKNCGKPIKRNVISVKQGYSGNQGVYFCSNSCSQKSQEHKDKMHKLALERYGANTISSAPQIIEKIKAVRRQHIEKDPEYLDKIRKKMEQTCFNRYGAKNPMQVEDIRTRAQETYKKTMMERYGATSGFKAKSIQDKIKSTNRKRYGVDYTLQSRQYQEKMQKLAQTNEAKQKRIQKHRIQAYNRMVSKSNVIIPKFSLEEYLALERTCRTYSQPLLWHCNECNTDFYAIPFQNCHKFEWARCLRCHPKIFDGTSEAEKEVAKYIADILPNESIIMNDRTILKNPATGCMLELDIYIPSLKRAIEYQGTYWHSVEGNIVAVQHDELKRNLCQQLGIKLLQLEESTWKYARNVAKQLIREFLTND